jgi:alpha-ketoglutarate-dependent taurine dioxygenase
MAAHTNLEITPLDATLGATVTGINLADLDDATWRAVEAAFHQYGLLVFPAQHLTPDAQTAFGERFGRIEELAPTRKFVPITNKRADGTLLRDDEHGMQIMIGNEGWHTDSSYMRVSAKASVLSAHVVPSQGGQTEWADMRAAYDALDDATRARLDGLVAFHSLRYSQAKIGHQVAVGAGYGFQDGTPPLRPLVKRHPITGRNALYIGRHAYGIVGMEPAESEQLLEELVEFACQPPRTYLHQRQPGDVVIWDNRCLLHRARPYNHSEARVMVHVRVRGEDATETAVNY